MLVPDHRATLRRCDLILRFEAFPARRREMRIAFFTDLHLRGREARLRRLIREIRENEPEMILIGGDFAGRDRFEPSLLAPLAGLQAPLGVYAVPGNWEYKVGVPIERQAGVLADLGIRLLINESVAIEEGIRLVGLDDPYTGRDDLERALRGVPGGTFRIVLAHSPDPVRDGKMPDGIHLLLCGHTHGGQIRLPWIGAPILNTAAGRRYADGTVRWADGRVLHVSRGVGTSGVPFRFRCDPEYTMLEIGSAPHREGNASGPPIGDPPG